MNVSAAWFPGTNARKITALSVLLPLIIASGFAFCVIGAAMCTLMATVVCHLRRMANDKITLYQWFKWLSVLYQLFVVAIAFVIALSSENGAAQARDWVPTLLLYTVGVNGAFWTVTAVFAEANHCL